MKDTELGLQWFCYVCKKPAMKSVKTDLDIEERCKAYFDKMEQRLDEIKEKLELKADRAELTELRNDLDKVKKDLQQKNNDEMITMKNEMTDLLQKQRVEIDIAVEREVNEFRARESKKSNIILYEVEESELEDKNENKTDDLKKVTNFIKNDLGMKTAVHIDKTVRIGKNKSSKEPGGATALTDTESTKKVRPLKVIFTNYKEKNEIMSAYWAKKDDQVKLKYGMSNDFTRYETEKYRKLKKELKEREEKGEQDLVIRRLKIVKKK